MEDDAAAEAVTTTAETLVADAINAAVNGGDADVGGGEEDDDEEYVEMDEKLSYLSPLLRLLTMTHLFISFSILVAYYQLKVNFCIQLIII